MNWHKEPLIGIYIVVSLLKLLSMHNAWQAHYKSKAVLLMHNCLKYILMAAHARRTVIVLLDNNSATKCTRADSRQPTADHSRKATNNNKSADGTTH